LGRLADFDAQGACQLFICQRTGLAIDQTQGIQQVIRRLNIAPGKAAFESFADKTFLAAQLALLSKMVYRLADNLPGQVADDFWLLAFAAVFEGSVEIVELLRDQGGLAPGGQQ